MAKTTRTSRVFKSDTTTRAVRAAEMERAGTPLAHALALLGIKPGTEAGREKGVEDEGDLVALMYRVREIEDDAIEQITLTRPTDETREGLLEMLDAANRECGPEREREDCGGDDAVDEQGFASRA